MTDYSVLVEAHAPPGASARVHGPGELQGEGFAELLAGWHATVSVSPAGWSARVSIDADDPLAAATAAARLVSDAAAAAKLPAWPLRRVEAVAGEVLDAELARPNYPELVSGAEAAAMLGVTRQRVHQLHRDHPDFPAPLYQLKVGPLWQRQAIEAFDRRWTRRPGRPARPRDLGDQRAAATAS